MDEKKRNHSTILRPISVHCNGDAIRQHETCTQHRFSFPLCRPLDEWQMYYYPEPIECRNAIILDRASHIKIRPHKYTAHPILTTARCKQMRNADDDDGVGGDKTPERPAKSEISNAKRQSFFNSQKTNEQTREDRDKQKINTSHRKSAVCAEL